MNTVRVAELICASPVQVKIIKSLVEERNKHEANSLWWNLYDKALTQYQTLMNYQAKVVEVKESYFNLDDEDEKPSILKEITS